MLRILFSMEFEMSLTRPDLPPGFDASRARERREDPAGWRFSEAEVTAVGRAIAERRDIRRFRPDPLPDDLLRRLLEAAHRAPSVGLMQPWRFIVVRSPETKAAMQAIAARERLVQAEYLEARTRHYLDLKIEGIREAPVSVCVCCDRRSDGREVLGRHTIRDTDLYSTCLAIQNLWLAARAAGVGVGWVSFYRPDDVRALLGLPQEVVPVAWLCLGYPDERPTRPGLEAAGWDKRRPLEDLVYEERWGGPSPFLGPSPSGARRDLSTRQGGALEFQPPVWLRELLEAVLPADATAALRVRDESDELVKPAGSLGALETALERWAAAAGGLPAGRPRAAVLVFAADHGVARQPVSLFPSRVGGQVAEAAARGETAIGVLARALGAELVVADVGLRDKRRRGLVERRVAEGSADISAGPALTVKQLKRAVLAGHELATGFARSHDLLLLGEIGIGNTTVAAALLAGLTGLPPETVCGRGTGLDAQGLERKRAVVAAALAANPVMGAGPLECLRRLGGLEFAALVGAILAGAAARRLMVLDGLAVGVSALVACRLRPASRDYLIAGHRSAEPAHALVLRELGLEPLLDLRLRLGEASGAALAAPLMELAARLHGEMGSFADTAVDGPQMPHAPE
jgi:nicotinate-nucleotide--dimethylbenzimidazole phosphoribosyltransferase